MQSQRFPHAQPFHHYEQQQQQPMQMHFVHHAPRPTQLSPTWAASSNSAVERMALPALNTALLPSLQMQRMTLQSPSVSVVGVTAPGQSPTKKRVRALPNASKSITLDLLRPHFEKPLAEVAAMFGICMTLMKKICRKNGVPRWPHRQIRGLRKSIWSIEKALRCCDSDAQRRSYNDHLHKQRAKLATILRGPDGPSRAAFDKILAEPLSPASDRAASPVSTTATTTTTTEQSEASSALSNTSFSLQRFSAIAAAASPVISTGKITPPAVVKLPPIASLLRASGESSMQRTGYFSGTFQI